MKKITNIIKNDNIILKIIIVIYNTLLFLIPYSLKFKCITYPKIIFLYSIIVTIYLILKKDISLKLFKNKTLKYITIGYALFTSIVAVSVITNTIIEKKIIFSNFLEIFRTIQYYLIILNYYVLLKDNKNIFKISFVIVLIINIILAFFQFYNIFGLNELYIKIIAPTQYKTLINGYNHPRVVGLAGNPNVFGFFIAISVIYILYLIFENPKKWYYYLVYIFLIITMFLTSSRTSYVSMVIGSIILILLYYFRFNIKNIIKTFIICITFVAFQLLLLFSLPDAYTWRIKQLVDLSSITSWQNRIQSNKEFIEDFDSKDEKNNNLEISVEVPKDSNDIDNINNEQNKNRKVYTYFIGNGPDKLKDKHNDYFDNEWFMLLFNYGIVGIICYLFMLLFPLFSIKKNKKFNYILYISLMIANFIYMIAAASYNCYLLFNLFCIFISITINGKVKKNVQK